MQHNRIRKERHADRTRIRPSDHGRHTRIPLLLIRPIQIQLYQIPAIDGEMHAAEPEGHGGRDGVAGDVGVVGAGIEDGGRGEEVVDGEGDGGVEEEDAGAGVEDHPLHIALKCCWSGLEAFLSQVRHRPTLLMVANTISIDPFDARWPLLHGHTVLRKASS